MSVPAAVEWVGFVKVRGCCVFLWRESDGGVERLVELRPDHCAACIEALRAAAPGARLLRVVRVVPKLDDDAPSAGRHTQ